MEQIIDGKVPQDVEELVEVFKVSFSPGQGQTAFCEADHRNSCFFKGPLRYWSFRRKKGRQVANTHVRHVVNTIEAGVPLSQFIDMAVEIPVVAQRQISMVQTVQMSIEIPQLQHCDEVIDVPVVSVVQVPHVCVVKKTVEDPQFEIVEKTVENPETQTIQGSDVLVPQVQVVEKMVEMLQVQFFDRAADVPVVMQRHVPQSMAEIMEVVQLMPEERIHR